MNWDIISVLYILEADLFKIEFKHTILAMFLSHISDIMRLIVELGLSKKRENT